jgi:FkbM family methyltransferase
MTATDDMIFDIGLHHGQDTDFYLRKGFRVVAVEAHPELAARAARRFESFIRSGQLRIVQRAVSSKPGPVDFFVNTKHPEWNSTSLTWVSRFDDPVERLSVETITLDELIHVHGVPHYLKIDIEGEDSECLRQLLRTHARPHFLSMEADTVDRSGAGVREQVDLLEGLGYRKFQIVNQAVNSGIKAPFPAREGAYCDFDFEFGSSGLFGRELPGTWVSAARLKRMITRRVTDLRLYGLQGERARTWRGKIHRRIKQIMGDPLGWYDIHCTT